MAEKDWEGRRTARAEYQEFLGIWKDADRDTPVLVAAKAEYEKVR